MISAITPIVLSRIAGHFRLDKTDVGSPTTRVYGANFILADTELEAPTQLEV